jgi:predicted enzyme related to lactoylglutathione lyase
VTDPFEALRSPAVGIEAVAIDPDPDFAARLRARIERALDQPGGPPMSEVTFDPDADQGHQPVPELTPPRHGDVGYVSLWVPDVERAAAFFSAVLGWRYAPAGGPRERQVEGTARPHGLWGGQERSTLFLCFAVDDIEAVLERVESGGGRAGRARREPYGVVADCADDQGMPFALVESAGSREPRPAPRPPAAAGTAHGDLAYITMEVVDSGHARTFYGSVLGWRYSPGHAEGGWEVEDVAPMVGMIGGAGTATIVPMYRVDDVAGAVDRVRAAGGTATDPERQPYGVTSSCVDDQGTRFYLGEL